MGIDPDVWRDYQLLQLGITPGSADHVSGMRLDWLLAVDGIIKEETNAQRSPQ